jgi:hypothetical protein
MGLTFSADVGLWVALSSGFACEVSLNPLQLVAVPVTPGNGLDAVVLTPAGPIFGADDGVLYLVDAGVVPMAVPARGAITALGGSEAIGYLAGSIGQIQASNGGPWAVTFQDLTVGGFTQIVAVAPDDVWAVSNGPYHLGTSGTWVSTQLVDLLMGDVVLSVSAGPDYLVVAGRAAPVGALYSGGFVARYRRGAPMP